MTALSGGSISDESLAISTAIFAAPYADLQADSLVDPGLSGTRSVGSEDGRVVDDGVAPNEAASPPLLTWGLGVAEPFFTFFAAGGGGVGDGLCGGFVDDEGFFLKRGMVNARTKSRRFSRRPWQEYLCQNAQS